MHFAIRAPKRQWHSLMSRLKTPVTGLCLSIGLVVSGMTTFPMHGADISPAVSREPVVSQVSNAPDPDLTSQTVSSQPSVALDDGIYLYGQRPEPDQLGVTYLVFEVSQRQVIGAFYMPHSSFDCFQGEFQANQLALQITDSYEQVTFPYSIALTRNGAIAASDDVATPPIELTGFDPISTVSENDHRILSICKADQETNI